MTALARRTFLAGALLLFVPGRKAAAATDNLAVQMAKLQLVMGGTLSKPLPADPFGIYAWAKAHDGLEVRPYIEHNRDWETLEYTAFIYGPDKSHLTTDNVIALLYHRLNRYFQWPARQSEAGQALLHMLGKPYIAVSMPEVNRVLREGDDGIEARVVLQREPKFAAFMRTLNREELLRGRPITPEGVEPGQYMREPLSVYFRCSTSVGNKLAGVQP